VNNFWIGLYKPGSDGCGLTAPGCIAFRNSSKST
jgi:hypothetical protein